ncbi:TetR/AcrR family transcriptional regulator [Puniceicoccaceae bacterium K14]|nr:TetR/AcrR family transcriptional regulator [Puniceicoccaceae bacterium K14]
MSSERRQKIIDTTFELFLQYGFQKVTLSDIAKEVGVSRPTLYQEFANKEEIFISIIDLWQKDALCRIKEGMNPKEGADVQLRKAIDVWVIEPFQMIHNSPKSAEFSETHFCFANEVFAIGLKEFEKLIVGILGKRPLAGGISANDVAHLIAYSTKGFKSLANSEKELRSLIDNLIVVVLG